MSASGRRRPSGRRWRPTTIDHPHTDSYRPPGLPARPKLARRRSFFFLLAPRPRLALPPPARWARPPNDTADLLCVAPVGGIHLACRASRQSKRLEPGQEIYLQPLSPLLAGPVSRLALSARESGRTKEDNCSEREMKLSTPAGRPPARGLAIERKKTMINCIIYNKRARYHRPPLRLSSAATRPL